jgi:putative glutamine amidotransferase
MKRFILLITVTLLSVSLFSQDFFRGDFSKDKKYVIIVNPTAGNIGVVTFLLDKGILDTNDSMIEFVGVYHSRQEYDFSKSAEYIAANGLTRFHLHEVKAPLTEDMVYKQNPCSDDFSKIFSNSVGIIFFGGQDIPPAVYGQENWYSETTDPGRHYFEVSFLFHLLGGTRNTAHKPLLEDNPEYMVTGFCLGLQSMNVAAGGTLWQDIPAQVYESTKPETHVLIDRKNLHRNYWQNIRDGKDFMGINMHPVRFTESTFFGNTVKVSRNMQPIVYSSHHQAIHDLAPVFEVTARSDDGRIIEGIAHRKYPNVFSVQFHPEVSALYENRALVKFAPEDTPATLHSMLDKKSLKFHIKYWKHISEVINKGSRQ